MVSPWSAQATDLLVGCLKSAVVGEASSRVARTLHAMSRERRGRGGWSPLSMYFPIREQAPERTDRSRAKGRLALRERTDPQTMDRDSNRRCWLGRRSMTNVTQSQAFPEAGAGGLCPRRPPEIYRFAAKPGEKTEPERVRRPVSGLGP